MRFYGFLLMAMVIGGAALLVIVLRKPEVRKDSSALGHGLECGVRDASGHMRNATKDGVQ